MNNKFDQLIADAQAAYAAGLVPITGEFFEEDESGNVACACALGAAYVTREGPKAPLFDDMDVWMRCFASGRYGLTDDEYDGFIAGFDGHDSDELHVLGQGALASGEACAAGRKARDLFL